jgi:mediator of RNA polymerase II transcription subunit 21
MADIVTELQESVDRLNGAFYNSVGVLQRDAKPASVVEGADPSEGVDEAQVREMARSVVDESRKIDELASALPPVDLDADAQLARIAKLQEEDHALGEELRAELTRAKKTLTKVTAAFEAVADDVLLAREETTGGDADT